MGDNACAGQGVYMPAEGASMDRARTQGPTIHLTVARALDGRALWVEHRPC